MDSEKLAVKVAKHIGRGRLPGKVVAAAPGWFLKNGVSVMTVNEVSGAGRVVFVDLAPAAALPLAEVVSYVIAQYTGGTDVK